MTITMTLIYMTTAALLLDDAVVEDTADDVAPTNHCVSADPNLGDTAYWAVTAVELFAAEKYAESIEALDYGEARADRSRRNCTTLARSARASAPLACETSARSQQTAY